MLQRSSRLAMRMAGAFAIVLTLILAACGSSASPVQGTSSPGSAAGAGASKQSPIRLGVIYLLSGKFAQYGTSNIEGTKLALAKINQAGGINGRPLELEVQDNASDPAQAAALVRKFAADASLLGIIGPTGSSDLVAAAPVADQEKIMVLSTGSASPWSGQFNPWTFRMNLVSSDAIPGVLKSMAGKRSWKKVAVVYDLANEFTVGERDVVKRVAGDAGLTLVATESFRTGDSDFTAQLAKVAPLKPDVIWLAATTNEAGVIIRQAREQGIGADVIGGAGLNDPQILKLSGGKAEGILTFFGFDASDSRPVVKELVDAYKQQYKAEPAPYVALGYDAVLLMASALKNAKTLDRTGLRDAFGALKGVEGTSGSYTYQGPGDNKTPNFHVMALKKDGTFAAVP